MWYCLLFFIFNCPGFSYSQPNGSETIESLFGSYNTFYNSEENGGNPPNSDDKDYHKMYVCRLPLEPGSQVCNTFHNYLAKDFVHVKRYYHNPITHTCERYSICEYMATFNDFASIEECESVCIPEKTAQEPTTEDFDQNIVNHDAVDTPSPNTETSKTTHNLNDRDLAQNNQTRDNIDTQRLLPIPEKSEREDLGQKNENGDGIDTPRLVTEETTLETNTNDLDQSIENDDDVDTHRIFPISEKSEHEPNIYHLNQNISKKDIADMSGLLYIYENTTQELNTDDIDQNIIGKNSQGSKSSGLDKTTNNNHEVVNTHQPPPKSGKTTQEPNTDHVDRNNKNHDIVGTFGPIIVISTQGSNSSDLNETNDNNEIVNTLSHKPEKTAQKPKRDVVDQNNKNHHIVGTFGSIIGKNTQGSNSSDLYETNDNHEVVDTHQLSPKPEKTTQKPNRDDVDQNNNNHDIVGTFGPIIGINTNLGETNDNREVVDTHGLLPIAEKTTQESNTDDVDQNNENHGIVDIHGVLQVPKNTTQVSIENIENRDIVDNLEPEKSTEEPNTDDIDQDIKNNKFVEIQGLFSLPEKTTHEPNIDNIDNNKENQVFVNTNALMLENTSQESSSDDEKNDPIDIVDISEPITEKNTQGPKTDDLEQNNQNQDIVNTYELLPIPVKVTEDPSTYNLDQTIENHDIIDTPGSITEKTTQGPNTNDFHQNNHNDDNLDVHGLWSTPEKNTQILNTDDLDQYTDVDQNQDLVDFHGHLPKPEITTRKPNNDYYSYQTIENHDIEDIHGLLPILGKVTQEPDITGLNQNNKNYINEKTTRDPYTDYLDQYIINHNIVKLNNYDLDQTTESQDIADTHSIGLLPIPEITTRKPNSDYLDKYIENHDIVKHKYIENHDIVKPNNYYLEQTIENHDIVDTHSLLPIPDITTQKFKNDDLYQTIENYDIVKPNNYDLDQTIENHDIVDTDEQDTTAKDTTSDVGTTTTLPDIQQTFKVSSALNNITNIKADLSSDYLYNDREFNKDNDDQYDHVNNNDDLSQSVKNKTNDVYENIHPLTFNFDKGNYKFTTAHPIIQENLPIAVPYDNVDKSTVNSISQQTIKKFEKPFFGAKSNKDNVAATKNKFNLNAKSNIYNPSTNENSNLLFIPNMKSEGSIISSNSDIFYDNYHYNDAKYNPDYEYNDNDIYADDFDDLIEVSNENLNDNLNQQFESWLPDKKHITDGKQSDILYKFQKNDIFSNKNDKKKLENFLNLDEYHNNRQIPLSNNEKNSNYNEPSLPSYYKFNLALPQRFIDPSDIYEFHVKTPIYSSTAKPHFFLSRLINFKINQKKPTSHNLQTTNAKSKYDFNRIVYYSKLNPNERNKKNYAAAPGLSYNKHNYNFNNVDFSNIKTFDTSEEHKERIIKLFNDLNFKSKENKQDAKNLKNEVDQNYNQKHYNEKKGNFIVLNSNEKWSRERIYKLIQDYILKSRGANLNTKNKNYRADHLEMKRVNSPLYNIKSNNDINRLDNSKVNPNKLNKYSYVVPGLSYNSRNNNFNNVDNSDKKSFDTSEEYKKNTVKLINDLKLKLEGNNKGSLNYQAEQNYNQKQYNDKIRNVLGLNSNQEWSRERTIKLIYDLILKPKGSSLVNNNLNFKADQSYFQNNNNNDKKGNVFRLDPNQKSKLSPYHELNARASLNKNKNSIYNTADLPKCYYPPDYMDLNNFKYLHDDGNQIRDHLCKGKSSFKGLFTPDKKISKSNSANDLLRSTSHVNTNQTSPKQAENRENKNVFRAKLDNIQNSDIPTSQAKTYRLYPSDYMDYVDARFGNNNSFKTLPETKTNGYITNINVRYNTNSKKPKLFSQAQLPKKIYPGDYMDYVNARVNTISDKNTLHQDNVKYNKNSEKQKLLLQAKPYTKFYPGDYMDYVNARVNTISNKSPLHQDYVNTNFEKQKLFSQAKPYNKLYSGDYIDYFNAKANIISNKKPLYQDNIKHNTNSKELKLLLQAKLYKTIYSGEYMDYINARDNININKNPLHQDNVKHNTNCKKQILMFEAQPSNKFYPGNYIDYFNAEKTNSNKKPLSQANTKDFSYNFLNNIMDARDNINSETPLSQLNPSPNEFSKDYINFIDTAYY